MAFCNINIQLIGTDSFIRKVDTMFKRLRLVETGINMPTLVEKKITKFKFETKVEYN